MWKFTIRSPRQIAAFALRVGITLAVLANVREPAIAFCCGAFVWGTQIAVDGEWL